jgi:ribosome-associated heat shock protein Hsp15
MIGRAEMVYRVGVDSVRLDVWLDVACLFKTRAQAKAACDGGKVDVNGARGRPHREIRPGDRLTITTESGRRREILVRGLADRSLAKTQARALYEDLTPKPTEEALEIRRLDRLMKGEDSGKPSARDRREIRKWKGRE